jgi:hypothetical protein
LEEALAEERILFDINQRFLMAVSLQMDITTIQTANDSKFENQAISPIASISRSKSKMRMQNKRMQILDLQSMYI